MDTAAIVALCVVGVLLLAALLLRAVRVQGVDGQNVLLHSKSHPVWGVVGYMHANLVKQSSKSYGELLQEEFELNGFRPFALPLPGKVVIQVASPADVKHVVQGNFRNFEKGNDLKEITSRLLGRGIFTTDGQEWKDHRTCMAHLFTRRTLRGHVSDVFGMASQELVQSLSSAAGEGQPTDMQAVFLDALFDSTSRVLLSGGSHLSDTASQRSYADAFGNALQLASDRFFSPMWKLDERLQLSSAERALTQHLKVVDAYLEERVSSYLNADGTPNDEARDGTLASELVDHLDPKMGDPRTTLRNMFFGFFFGGRDTTAAALTSCVEFLSAHPEWQSRLHAEALEVFGDELDRPLTMDDIEGCSPVAEAIYLESVRLKPSVVAFERVALSDCTLPSGVEVKAGQCVGFAPHNVNRNPAQWGEDASEFRPERWMGEQRPDDYTFASFSAGPRACIGKGMSVLQAKIMLLTLYSRLQFTVAPNHVPAHSLCPTLHRANGLPAYIHTA
eukprot:TRINITY_DN5588_c0_g1_i5.p1 TRINITY_DN5588_c0_g1~~TRINITY_DN5588_c0_g1_i5.p1  ORF type:complete len:556 (+),score=227.73 TRINITY_DN5588_c0_g1_i5:158-1669(+)